MNAVTTLAKEGDLQPEATLALPKLRVPVILVVVAVPLSAASMPVATIDVDGEALTEWSEAS